ncbi:MAG TPA: helix-turn-helix domain-containing protein [Pseudolabrys sp.]|nr:helix-turn-helix domain-containing protein [Pseudolabrys sp.]
MPRNATFVFDDPIPYQAAIRSGEAEIIPTGKGNFRAEWTRLDCGRLWLQYASEALPRAVHTTVNPKRLVIIFLTDQRQAPIHYSGMELTSDAIVVGLPGSTRHIRSHQPCQWASLSLTQEDFSAASSALLSRELLHKGPPTRLVHPDPAHMARFVRLHATTRQLAETAPEIFKHPEVPNAIQHELVYAMVRCLENETRAKVTAGWRHHTAIMKRFEDFVANCDGPLHVEDICAAIGTSERMLRICCHEQLSMGPARYLWLRRMNLARRALIDADPAKTCVTQLLTQYGFWQLGRFAVAYQGLFGESPSKTLRGRSNPQRTFQKNFHRPPKDSENE